jgi:hypothetical protein
VIKAGFSERQRWRAFQNRGAKLVDLVEFDTTSDALAFESVVLGMFEIYCDPAFRSASDAVGILGGRGAGYLECYVLPTGVTPLELLHMADWSKVGSAS